MKRQTALSKRLEKTPWLLAVTFTACIALALAGCEGDSGSDGTDIAAQAKAVADVERDYVEGKISDDQLFVFLADRFEEIDRSDNGPARLKAYLEQEVAGYRFDTGVSASVSATLAVDVSLARFSVGDITNALNRIIASEAFQVVKTMGETVAMAFVAEPAGTLVQVADPELFKTFSAVDPQTKIKDAYYSNQISFEEYQLIMETSRGNPYAAIAQLLQATGQPVPSWLSQAAAGTLQGQPPTPNEDGDGAGGGDATDAITGTWAGTYDYRIEAECVWNHAGSMTMTLTRDGDYISGSVTMTGVKVLDHNCAPVEATTVTESLTASVSGSQISGNIGDEIVFDGTLSGNTLSGELLGFGSGSFSLKK